MSARKLNEKCRKCKYIDFSLERNFEKKFKSFHQRIIFLLYVAITEYTQLASAISRTDSVRKYGKLA